MRYVRVKAIFQQGAVKTEFPEAAPMVVDLRISDDDTVACQGHMFGAFGIPGHDEYYPFKMDVNGVVDFGSCAARNAQTNLLDRPIRPGTCFSYRNEPGPVGQTNPEAVLRIENVDVLMVANPAQ